MGFGGAPRRNVSCDYKNDRVFAKGGGVVLKRKGRARMKLHRLERIIPGGEGLKPDQLMVHTADYILHLRLQLGVLEALLKLHQTS